MLIDPTSIKYFPCSMFAFCYVLNNSIPFLIMTKCSLYTLLLPLDVQLLTIRSFPCCFPQPLPLSLSVYIRSKAARQVDGSPQRKQDAVPPRPSGADGGHGRKSTIIIISIRERNRCCRRRHHHRLFLFPFGRPEEHGLLPIFIFIISLYSPFSRNH